MKKILSLALIFAFAFTFVSCGEKTSDGKETNKAPAENTVHIGDNVGDEPEEDGNVAFALPVDFEFLVKGEDGEEIDLYTATAEELKALSDKKCDDVFPNLEEKQDIANIAAELFDEFYPDKGVVHKGMTVYMKSNRNAKGLICHAEGSDGGSACVAIDNQTGEIIMVTYID